MSAEKELDNLTKLRIRDLLTDDEYLKQRQELERNQVKIAQNLKTADQPDDRFEPARVLVSFSNRAASLTETLKSVRELSRHLKEVGKKAAA